MYNVVLGFALSIIGFLLSLQGLWLLSLALFPRRVARAADRCRHHGIASFFVGILITGVALLIGAVLARRGGGPRHGVGGLFLSLFTLYAGVGMSGLVTFIGQRLPTPSDAIRPWRTTVRGGIVLELAYLLPIVGWFVLLPFSVIMGAGAITLSFFGGDPKPNLRGTLAASRSAHDDIADLPSVEPQEAGV